MIPKSLPSGLTLANRMFPICVHLEIPELGNTRVLVVDTGFRKRSCSTKRLERDDDSKKSHHAPVARNKDGVRSIEKVRQPLDDLNQNTSTDDNRTASIHAPHPA